METDRTRSPEHLFAAAEVIDSHSPPPTTTPASLPALPYSAAISQNKQSRKKRRRGAYPPGWVSDAEGDRQPTCTLLSSASATATSDTVALTEHGFQTNGSPHTAWQALHERPNNIRLVRQYDHMTTNPDSFEYNGVRLQLQQRRMARRAQTYVALPVVVEYLCYGLVSKQLFEWR